MGTYRLKPKMHETPKYLLVYKKDGYVISANTKKQVNDILKVDKRGKLELPIVYVKISTKKRRK